MKIFFFYESGKVGVLKQVEFYYFYNTIVFYSVDTTHKTYINDSLHKIHKYEKYLARPEFSPNCACDNIRLTKGCARVYVCI